MSNCYGLIIQNILISNIAITLNLQIVFREDFGTEGRGGYFDEYGYVYFMHFENWTKHTFQTKDQIFFLELESVLRILAKLDWWLEEYARLMV